MSRYDAPSDLDYYAEGAPHLDMRCRDCGEEMEIVYDSDGHPVWARCIACMKDAEQVRKADAA